MMQSQHEMKIVFETLETQFLFCYFPVDFCVLPHTKSKSIKSAETAPNKLKSIRVNYAPTNFHIKSNIYYMQDCASPVTFAIQFHRRMLAKEISIAISFVRFSQIISFTFSQTFQARKVFNIRAQAVFFLRIYTSNNLFTASFLRILE